MLAAFAGDGQGAVPALGAQVLDVRAGRLGHSQPVQGEQRARTAPGSGSSGDHVYSHPAWPGRRQGLAGLLAGYPVASSAR